MTSMRRITSRTINRDVQQQENMVVFNTPLSRAIYPNYFSVPDASENCLLVSTGSQYSATAAPKLTFDGSTLDVSGNVAATGTIRAQTYLPGQVINVMMFDISNVTQSSPTTSIGPSSLSKICSRIYTPVVANSAILIEYQSIYTLTGPGTDQIQAYIDVSANGSDTRISSTLQKWVGAITNVPQSAPASGGYSVNTGAGTRSGIMFPIVGKYINTSLLPKTINIIVDATGTDDIVTVRGDISTWLKITEIGV